MKTTIIRVFDNGGKSWDRYTVVIYKDGQADVFGMSINADSPSGFNQWAGSVAELPAVLEVLRGGVDDNIGVEVPLTDIPPAVRVGIGARLASY